MEENKLYGTENDAINTVGEPGNAVKGKIYGKTGELLSEDEYGLRKERDDAVMGYDMQIDALNKAAAQMHVETPEERQKRERREKSKKVIAATVDGLSALANLFFTTQYAPSSYNPQASQLGKVNERIEALKAERQADADRYNNYMLRLGDAQNAKAKTIRDMRAQHEAQKLAREKAERDAEAHQWKALLQDDIRREQAGKADRAGFEALSSMYEAGNKPKELELKNATEIAKANHYNASAANSTASANAHDRQGIYGTFDGKVYYEKADYEKAVYEAAREYNKRHPKTEKRKRMVKGEDGKYVEEEYDAPVDAVPTVWMKQNGYGEEPKLYQASDVAANIEPLLRKEREEAEQSGNLWTPTVKTGGGKDTKWKNTSKLKW